MEEEEEEEEEEDGRKEGRKEGRSRIMWVWFWFACCVFVCVCMYDNFILYLLNRYYDLFSLSLSLSLSHTHGKILLREKKKESFRQHDFLAPKFVSEILAYTEEEKNTDWN